MTCDPEQNGSPPDEIDMGPIEDAVCSEVEDGIAEAIKILDRALKDGLTTLRSYNESEWADVEHSDVLIVIDKAMDELALYTKPEKAAE